MAIDHNGYVINELSSQQIEISSDRWLVEASKSDCYTLETKVRILSELVDRLYLHKAGLERR